MGMRISLTDTAKLVRAALKVAFPTTKFNVRSSYYANGTSISVSWSAGPNEDKVCDVAQKFEGAEFDPMCDLKTRHSTVLVDGSGVATEVNYGADYIFCKRDSLRL